MPVHSLLTFPFGENLQIAHLVKGGIRARALSELAAAFKLTTPALASAVMIPRRTLERRMADNAKLKPDEAERAVRLARLLTRASDVFEDQEEAAAWFSEPLAVLAGQTPLECCSTEAGAREVEQTLGRIEHGVFA